MLILAAAITGACSSGPAATKVTTYVRNGSSADVTVVVRPTPANAISNVVTAGNTGGRCDPVVAGTQILVTGGQPTADSPAGERLVALIGSQDPGTTRVIWVDVAGDGTVTTGTGQPDWWTAEAQTC